MPFAEKENLDYRFVVFLPLLFRVSMNSTFRPRKVKRAVMSTDLLFTFAAIPATFPAGINDHAENVSVLSTPLTIVSSTAGINLNLNMMAAITWGVALQAGYMGFICLVAVLANFLVAYTLVRKEQLMVPSNRLVFNLTASNFVFSLLILPFIVLSMAQQRWMFGIFWCNFTGFFTLLVGIASILTSVMIAIDRYYAIVKPMVYARTITMAKSTAMLLWVWIQATVCSMPPLFGWSRFDCLKTKAMCSVVWRDDIIYTSFLLIFCMFLPFGIMATCYYHIFQVVRSKCCKINVGTVATAKTAGEPQPPTSKGQPAASRLYIPRKSSLALLSVHSSPTKGFRTICILVGMFLATWASYISVAIADVACGPMCVADALRAVALCLLYSSCVGYPIVYGIYNRSIRKEIRMCLWPPNSKAMKGLPRRNSRRLSFSNAGGGGLFDYVPFRGRHSISSLSAQHSFDYGRASIDLGSLPGIRRSSSTRRPSQDSGAVMTESDMDTDFSFLPSHWFGRTGSGFHHLPAKLGFFRRRPSSPTVGGTREPFPILHIVDAQIAHTAAPTHARAETVAPSQTQQLTANRPKLPSVSKDVGSTLCNNKAEHQQQLADIPMIPSLPGCVDKYDDRKDKQRVLDLVPVENTDAVLFTHKGIPRVRGESVDEGIINDCVIQDVEA